MPRLTLPARAGILVVMAGVLVAHLLEVTCYAIAIAVMQRPGIGAIYGALEGNAIDFFYLSLTS
jgi:hypothetical protein